MDVFGLDWIGFGFWGFFLILIWSGFVGLWKYIG